MLLTITEIEGILSPDTSLAKSLGLIPTEAVVNGYGRHAKELPHAQVVIALKVRQLEIPQYLQSVSANPLLKF